MGSYSVKIIKGGASYFMIIILVSIMLFPLVWLYLSSIKQEVDMYSVPPVWISKSPTTENYVEVLKDNSFRKYFWNSLIVALSSTAITLLIGCPAAYAFAKYLWRGASIIFFFVLASRMFPPIVFVIPYFLMMRYLGFINTRLGLAIVYLSLQLPLAIWLLEAFFRDIPRELEDAGKVDGLSRFGVFLKIALPLSVPGLAVVTIFSFLLAWNEFLYALILTRTAAATTIPVGVAGWVSIFRIFWGKMSAAAGLYALPTLIFTFLVQKGMLKGLMRGGLKE